MTTALESHRKNWAYSTYFICHKHVLASRSMNVKLWHLQLLWHQKNNRAIISGKTKRRQVNFGLTKTTTVVVLQSCPCRTKFIDVVLAVLQRTVMPGRASTNSPKEVLPVCYFNFRQVAYSTPAMSKIWWLGPRYYWYPSTKGLVSMD